MGNSIKYSEGSESLALNKGNWWIGTGDTNKGPTAESGYWNAINPPDGGYTVYLNKESNGPSIHSITSDENLISFTNKISGNNYTTVAECLVYYQTQDDKLCVNREMENIVTDGLVLNSDAGHASSYPTSGTTWYDLSGGGNNGSLINGPTFSGGSMVFDGVDDYVTWGDNFDLVSSNISGFVWGKVNTLANYTPWIDKLSGGGNYRFHSDSVGRLVLAIRASDNTYQQTITTNVLSVDTWYNIGFTFDNSTREGKIYLNGNLIHSNTFTIDRGDTSTPLQTGYQANNGGTLDGAVATLFLYNRALSASEILQNYNAQKSRFGL